MSSERKKATGERPAQTVVDYVTIVLSPVLIMGLIGSLAFFLLEVFYRSDGPWKERLQWILFFYVFGAVLTARISMQADIASRSSLYGSILALCAYLGMQAYVELPPTIRPVSFAINLFLILLVWWCAHRLTWDCTNVDENADMNAAGLLQVSGLEAKPVGETSDDVVEAEEDLPPSKVRLTRFEQWWRRYRQYREKQSKKRTLGVWVVYFSLAALPIFGLGQALIPLSSPERRRFCFWQMTIYVGCALGLLLTTCFLGLRRYLRQKNLQMPGAMTRSWLSWGGVVILALLLVGAILPRPYSETSLLNIVRPADSAKRQASNMAVKGDSPGEGKGKPGEARTDPKAKGDKTADKGGDRGKGDKGGKGNKKGKGDERGEKRNDQNKDERNKTTAQKKAEESSKSNEQDRSSQQQQQDTNKIAQMLQKVGPWLKWLVFAVLAVVVGVALFRGGLGFLANFTDWARRMREAWDRFWQGLFAGKKEADEGEEASEQAAEEAERAVPFSAFANPFESGAASEMDGKALVRYSFRALEAWARERDLGRQADETAQEFLARLGEELPTLEQEATYLGSLHARVEYSDGGLPGGATETVRRFWERLEKVTEAPLSA